MLFGNTKSTFEISQILSGTYEGKPVKAIVLDKAEDSGSLLLMVLSDGASFEVSAEDANSWSVAPAPEARWVEVSESEEEEPFFTGYFPTLDDAIAAGRVFGQRGDFRVEIFAASDEEQAKISAG